MKISFLRRMTFTALVSFVLVSCSTPETVSEEDYDAMMETEASEETAMLPENMTEGSDMMMPEDVVENSEEVIAEETTEPVDAYDQVTADDTVVETEVAVPETDLNEETTTEGGVPSEEVVVEQVDTTYTAPSVAHSFQYKIRKGDTLSKIALRVYGDKTRFQEIADASGITNVNLVYVNQVITVPVNDTHSEDFSQSYVMDAPAGDVITVTVRPGDSLSTIAYSRLGKARFWKHVYKENSAGVKDPNRIFVGQVLRFSRVQAH